MTFQRVMAALVVLLIAGLAGSFYMNWRTTRPGSHPEGLYGGHGVRRRGRGLRAGAKLDAVQVERRQPALGASACIRSGPINTPSSPAIRSPPTACSATTIRSGRKPVSDRVTWSGNKAAASSMSSEAEGIVDLYQRKALDWVRRREHGGGLMEQSWLDRFRALMPPNGSVLDIGCGSAVPIARYLIETGHSVTGVDTSSTFIDLCRERYPAQEWLPRGYAHAGARALVRRHPGLGQLLPSDAGRSAQDVSGISAARGGRARR